MSPETTLSPPSEEHLTALPPQLQAAVTARSKWLSQARPDQVTPPGVDWPIWMALAGRGWGKTRTGAEDVAWFGCAHAETRIAIVAPTIGAARDVCVEGESGLLSVLPKVCVKTWNRSMGELVLWNGTIFKTYSATEPETLRGPQHHRAWGDEVAAWPEPETWDQLLFGLRLGANPQAVLTTTPKPTPLIRGILKTEGAMITRGSTFDNEANLPAGTLARLRDRYEGTRLGRQELFAELLEDIEGALWNAAEIDRQRVRAMPDLKRIVVSVDPSGTKGGGAGDDIGIVTAGIGMDGRYYVLEDASCNLSPDGWARRVKQTYDKWEADRVVAEKNFGGAMVESVLRTAAGAGDLPVRLVTASRGKIARAEPIAALYEQEKVSHVGEFKALEDQLCAMTPGGYVGEGSPDRADALVWALSELSGKKARPSLIEVMAVP
ncbi:MAG: terminase family protein [Qipengyuania sp.]|uniref:DNA-packaging protein n=1 Tax=Qipengyuania sp. TaxID=2004515 RepID=UPI003002922F